MDPYRFWEEPTQDELADAEDDERDELADSRRDA